MAKKIYINENNIYLLNEEYFSPDSFSYNGQYFDWSDYEAIPFIYDKKYNKFYFCEYNGSHMDLKKDITAQKKGYKDYQDFINNSTETENFYDDVDETCIELKNSIEGRAWLKSKFLAFWGKSISSDVINTIINFIEINFNCDFNNPHIVINNEIIDYEHYKINTNTDLGQDKKFREIHLMNQQDKRNNLSDFRKMRGKKIKDKLGDMTMAQYHSLIYQESKVNENFNLEVEPNELDLSNFNKKDTLHPSIWDNNDKINSKVRLKLLDISDDFIKFLETSWIKPKDILLTGSICNFNWSEESDIDVHILYDFKEIDNNIELVRDYFNSKKNEWNNDHSELNMYGFKVEMYVEDIRDTAVSRGIYSLNSDTWLKKPNKNYLDIKEKDEPFIKKISADIMNLIDKYKIEFKNTDDNFQLNKLYDKVNNLIYNLKKMRTNSLNNYGENSIGNIVYKLLRRKHYLYDIWQIKFKIYDKINSL